MIIKQSSKLKRLDFLKIDIEGSEMRALAGAADTIKQFRQKPEILVF